MKLWKQFHDLLPKNNSNKIPNNLQGIVLRSQLCGRALDLCKRVEESVLVSERVSMAVAEAIHKSDTLSTITENYKKFYAIMNTKRREHESFKSFESRFEAAVCN